MALTEQQKEVVRLMRAYQEEFDYACGALCHSVSDDFNLDDRCIDACLGDVAKYRANPSEPSGIREWNTEELDQMETFLRALKAIPEEERCPDDSAELNAYLYGHKEL
jgi:hypothetical protein